VSPRAFGCLISSFGRGSPWLLSLSESILPRTSLRATLVEVRSSEGLGGTLRWRNVKVQHIFGGELLKLANHGRGYALPPMALIDGEVVYVQL